VSGGVLVLDFLQTRLVLVFKIHYLGRMAVVRLALAITLRLLERFYCPLEVGLGFFKIPFRLVSLLLKELVLSLPKTFILVVVVHLILQLTLQLSSLTSETF